MSRTQVAVAPMLLLMLAGTPSAGAERLKVGIAAEPYPPFVSRDASGNWFGWEIEMIGAICVEAKLDCEITPTVWDAMLPSLATGKIDMIAAMFITDDRLRVIDFSDRYYKTPTVIVGSRSIRFDVTPQGMKGIVLGVQVATVHDVYARKHFSSTAAEIKTYQTQEDAEQDLAAGRIDAFQADATVAQVFLAGPGGSCCELKGRVSDDPSVLGRGAGIGIRKGNIALREKLNAAIESIRENGRYDDISKSYFSFDIYGN